MFPNISLYCLYFSELSCFTFPLTRMMPSFSVAIQMFPLRSCVMPRASQFEKLRPFSVMVSMNPLAFVSCLPLTEVFTPTPSLCPTHTLPSRSQKT